MADQVTKSDFRKMLEKGLRGRDATKEAEQFAAYHLEEVKLDFLVIMQDSFGKFSDIVNATIEVAHEKSEMYRETMNDASKFATEADAAVRNSKIMIEELGKELEDVKRKLAKANKVISILKSDARRTGAAEEEAAQKPPVTETTTKETHIETGTINETKTEEATESTSQTSAVPPNTGFGSFDTLPSFSSFTPSTAPSSSRFGTPSFGTPASSTTTTTTTTTPASSLGASSSPPPPTAPTSSSFGKQPMWQTFGKPSTFASTPADAKPTPSASPASSGNKKRKYGGLFGSDDEEDIEEEDEGEEDEEEETEGSPSKKTCTDF